MNLADTCVSALEALQMAKETAVAAQGGPADLTAMVDVTFASGQRGVAILQGEPRMVLAGALDELRSQFGRMNYVVLLSEAVVRDDPTPDELEAHRPGDLVDEHANAPTGRTSEALVAHAVDRNGNAAGAMVRFGYDDQGALVLGEFEPWEHVGGLLVDIMHASIVKAIG